MRFDRKHRKGISTARKRLLASGFQSQNAKKRVVPDMSGITASFGHWLAGFVAGEGHFGIARQARQAELFRPTFRLALRSDDDATLHEICRVLGFGKVTYHSTKTTHVASFGVHAYAEAMALVTLFRRFPLRAKKQLDFEAWARCVEYGHTTYRAKIIDIQHDLDLIRQIRHPVFTDARTSGGKRCAPIVSVKEITAKIKRLSCKDGRKLWEYRLGSGAVVHVRCEPQRRCGVFYCVWITKRNRTRIYGMLIAMTPEMAGKRARSLITKYGGSS